MSEDKYPKVVVGALICNSGGEILLIKQSKWKDTFSIPGGHVEWGEKLAEAITREVREETGLSISDLQQFNVSEYVLGNENAAEKHYIFIDFLCKADNGDIVLGEEASEFRWVKPEDAMDPSFDIQYKGFNPEIYKQFGFNKIVLSIFFC